MATATMEEPKNEEQKPKFRYRVNRGTHIDNDPIRKKSDGTPIERVFKAGDIVETNQELYKLNGGGEMMPKFEKLDDGETATREPHPMDRRADETPKQYAKRLAGLAAEAEKAAGSEDGALAASFDKMTEKELRVYAADEDIDLRGVNGVEAIRKLLKSQLTV